MAEVDIDTLKLIKHRDTDSPFAVDKDSNDNWREIEDWSVQVKQAFRDIEAGMGSISPERIEQLIKQLLRDSKRFYTIPRTMVAGEVINVDKDVVLTRSGNEYIFTIEGADKYFVSVVNVNEQTETHPSVAKTATEIKLFFDTQIQSDMRVLLF